METTEGKIRKKPKYWAISLAAIIATAFVVVQPAMHTAYAVTAEQINEWDDCEVAGEGLFIGDPVVQNTIQKGSLVKTIHAEKEIFFCSLLQGNLPVVVEVTTYVELFENITTREVLGHNAVVNTCVKESETATVLGCMNYIPPRSPQPTGTGCDGLNGVGLPVHPMEMNTVKFKNVAKTIETQKQIYFCELPDHTIKKVDIVLFTEIYESLITGNILSMQNHQIRCVVLVTDWDFRRDATVESCTSLPIITVSESGIPSN
jgi:hypothetical protein